jgi:hypothetical protein
MAISALVLLCLNGIAEGADARQQQPEIGHAMNDVASDPAGQDSALEIAFSRRAGKTPAKRSVSSGTRSSPQPEPHHLRPSEPRRTITFLDPVMRSASRFAAANTTAIAATR